ncbi:CPBP family intramembrane metalloprotease [Sesbania bispinosa]|nr:CPBP family intramembrane metalloprotease [Sesbania bispinosa]
MCLRSINKDKMVFLIELVASVVFLAARLLLPLQCLGILSTTEFTITVSLAILSTTEFTITVSLAILSQLRSPSQFLLHYCQQLSSPSQSLLLLVVE